MAPTKPKSKAQKQKVKERLRAKNTAGAQIPTVNARELLANATALLEVGDPENAARLARTAYQHIGDKGRQAGAALSILGQIHVELGEVDAARKYFLEAVGVDEDGTLPEDLGGGPEKFLWLAQLSEHGGQDSVSWFERGAAALRSQIQTLSDTLEAQPLSRDQQEAVISEKKRKLADTLCAVAEVYMTDLSWEEDAEQRCEALITEATMLSPEVPETWQTVANVRISQARTEEACEALKRSLGIWTDLPPEDPNVPPFPTRVSLVRLLIEVGMEEKAIEVVERLISEDDRSVEVWYLGGFGRYSKGKKMKQGEVMDDDWQAFWRSSRKWLSRCLKIFETEEYEDERLREHVQELLASIKEELGDAPEEDDDEDEVWQDTDEDGDGDSDSDEDAEMQ
ncbi:hypothetical protein B0H66DRAFT_56402 [Apodospora peruviana]|uniref:TPR domain-containing protein n=1 Tax=Apodospora peruviana TaxID=516989 RepID=A0AAE0MFG7_9PEZI|nr:hypothetical protein B0H66DRAFT_56402 [Apodospora peruviana]